ncbi:1,6-anhydro-N-acetylmuramyl-L-alanine amidase AmpD [Ferrovum sp. PN-J185]|nr:1,6-anhydro-N-acetylmuramyl-L-alanine amidase AmpD [Ferrovum sp. PN-J185]
MTLRMKPQGWVSEAAQVLSPNFNQRPRETEVSLIVIHCISLPPGEFGGEAISKLFLNQLDCDSHPYYESLKGLEVSSHFLIRRSGELIQYVSCNDRAWHAGISVWQDKSNCNDYSIGIELEGTTDRSFTEEQYLSLVELVKLLKKHYPITDIVGHQHIAPGRKDDPGPYFDWHRLTS